MSNGIRISDQSCQCIYKPSTCLRFVIEFRPHRNSSVELDLVGEPGADPFATWDLSILGLPEHPLSLERVKPLRIQYLALDFKTLDEEKLFLEGFDMISRIRKSDQEDYAKAKSRLMTRAH